MADNVVKVQRALIDAMDQHNATFDKRRDDLMAQMAKANEQLMMLQAEQNGAADAILKEYDAAYARAREADLVKEKAERELQSRAAIPAAKR